MEVHIEYPRYVYCLLLVCRPLPWPSHLLELIVLSVVGLQTSAGAVTSPGADCIVCCWFSDQCRGRHTSWSRLYCLLLVCRPVPGPSHLLELIVLSVVGLQTGAGPSHLLELIVLSQCLLLVCRPVPGPSHLLELMGLACSVSSLLTKPQFRS